MMSVLSLLLEHLGQEKWYLKAVLCTQGTVLITQHCSVANGTGNCASAFVTNPSWQGCASWGCLW